MSEPAKKMRDFEAALTVAWEEVYRCDVCGRFVSLDDLAERRATRRLVTPLSDFTREEYETICERHSRHV
jgi:hypothetical protein